MSRSTILTLILFFISISLFLLVILNVNARTHLINVYETITSEGNVLSKFDFNNSFDKFNKLTEVVKKEHGNYSIYIKDLSNSKLYTYNQDNTYYAASVYKLPVGVAVLKNIQDGKLSLDTTLPYLSVHYTDGTGTINQSPYGTMYTVDQLLTALYKDSDNVAQSILLGYLDVNTKNVSSSFPNNGKSDFYHVNISSTKEVGEYIEYIFSSDYLSDNNKEYLLNVMHDTSFDYMLADNLSIPFSHKIGLYGGIMHDCGITKDKQFVICVMSENTDQDTFIRIGKYISEFIATI